MTTLTKTEFRKVFKYFYPYFPKRHLNYIIKEATNPRFSSEGELLFDFPFQIADFQKIVGSIGDGL